MNTEALIQAGVAIQTRNHKFLGWLGIVTGIGMLAVPLFAPFKEGEEGLRVGFAVFALALAGGGFLFMKVMRARLSVTADLLLKGQGLTDPAVVEIRLKGNPFAFQARFRDASGKQHILQTRSESDARTILAHAFAGQNVPTEQVNR